MDGEPTPKEFRKKDDDYMRRAYIYSAILLILGVVGGILLADRIVTAEREREEAIEEQIDEDEPGDLPTDETRQSNQR